MYKFKEVFVNLVPAKSQVEILRDLSFLEFELLGDLCLTRPIHQFMSKMKCSKLYWINKTENYKFYAIEIAVETATCYAAGIYLSKVNNGNTRTKCEIC